MNSEI